MLHVTEPCMHNDLIKNMYHYESVLVNLSIHVYSRSPNFINGDIFYFKILIYMYGTC